MRVRHPTEQLGLSSTSASTLGTRTDEGRQPPPTHRRGGRVPRFHFNVYDGVSEVDRVGTELGNYDEARIEAMRLAGEILKNTAHRLVLGEDWRMEVTDDVGLILFRLDFTVLEAPAVSGNR